MPQFDLKRAISIGTMLSGLAVGGLACEGTIGGRSGGPQAGGAAFGTPADDPGANASGKSGTSSPKDPGSSNPGSSSGSGSSSPTAEPTSGPGAQPSACANPQARGTSDSSLRRLTTPQIVNTLKSLLGPTIMSDARVTVALDALPDDVIKPKVDRLALEPSSQLAGALYTIADRASEMAAASAADIFGACAKQVPVTDACATGFIQSFGLRVYRRPLGTGEVQAIMTTYSRDGGGLKGLQAVLVRLLQSPSMVFQLEDGGAPAAGGRVRLTDYEVAARISYLLADTTPDAALLEAAARGELGELQNVQAHAQRLLATPTAHAKMSAFFGFYLQTDLQPEPYAAAAKLDGVDTKNLRSEMRQELSDFINYQLFTRHAGLKDLLTSDAAFPRSANLAKVLETSVASGAEPARVGPAHAGIILRPMVLMGGTERTPAMHRGNVIRSQILCDVMPPPPPEAAKAIAAAGPNKTTSNRAHLEQITSDGGAMCMACHARINPLGFALEGYDQLGKPRSIETTYDSKGTPSGTFPVDTVVRDPDIEEGGTATLSGAGDLVAAVAASTKARACIALTAFQYYRARGKTDADDCALADLLPATGDGASLEQLFVKNVALEDIFWKGN